MAIALINIFGSEIKVYSQPCFHERQFTGYAGAHGLTTMGMGTRGREIVVTGIIRAATRVLCQSAINAIETYVVNAPANDYIFSGITYIAVVFDCPRLIPDGEGKVFHYTSSGYFVQFVCYGRGLI